MLTLALLFGVPAHSNGPPYPSIQDCQTVFIYGSYQTTDTAAQRYTYYDCGPLSAEITLYQTTPPGGVGKRNLNRRYIRQS